MVEADEVARRYDVPADAVATLLTAIRRGGGRQAQFSHPALGGMGQWSRGGGIMIGDMFNHSLKAKVEQLCNALAEHAEEAGLPADDTAHFRGGWWPRDLGRPSSAGSQNDEAYACFPDKRRLAVRDAGGMRLYDTGVHRISGVFQQQGGGRDVVFSSQNGTVRLSDLEPVKDREAFEPARSDDVMPGDAVDFPAKDLGGDPLALLERLHELQLKGVLSEEEYAAKKKELLARL